MLRRIEHRLPRLSGVAAGLAILAGAWLALLPPDWLPPPAAKAAALAIVAIGFWATSILPEHLTAIAFFLLAMLFQVAPARVIFSGFESTAFWLIFGGLVIGVAVRRSGLGERIAGRLTGGFGGTYLGLVGGVLAIGTALGFVMPSSIGRLVLLMPVALGLADRFGFAEGRPGRTGLVLAAAFGSHVATFSILPANVPNMVLIGAAETLYGVTPVYGEYLLLHFPVLGLLKSLITLWLIVLLYPDRPRPPLATDELPRPRTMSGQELALSAILVLALAFWVTDFLHHISPAWIGLAAALVCLLPGVGLVPGNAFNEQINYGSLFYVAGIMGLGAMVAESGLGSLLAERLLAFLPLEPGRAAQNFAGLSVLAMLIGLATTLPGTPAVLTPLAGDMAKAAGLPIEAVLMTQVVGFSTVLLPYQSAPLVVAMQLGGQPVLPALKLCLATAAMTLLVLFPLDFLWWRLLGWI